jgi:hypothetical protein
MKTFSMMLLSALLLMLSACQAIHNNNVAEDFDKGTKSYFRMVRWNELDKTTLYFVDEPLREEFEKRIKVRKEVQIADYRVKHSDCSPEKGEGEVTVEWDYYAPPSIRLKTVEDAQKWRYIEKEGKKGWMLKTLLPEFK